MIHQRITVATMPVNSQPSSEPLFSEAKRGYELPNSMLCKTAIVERLPFALNYATRLESGDHAVLFYDNLVAAAEYFCAFVEEGIRRRELTCFTGLEPRLYRGLFEQVGIRVAELENCGYLRNLPPEDNDEVGQTTESGFAGNNGSRFNNRLVRTANGVQFVHVHGPDQQDGSPRDIMETERGAHNFPSLQTISICCYDATLVLEDAPAHIFTQLLKTHNHCFFQGIAMRTSKLLGPQANALYPKVSA